MKEIEIFIECNPPKTTSQSARKCFVRGGKAFITKTEKGKQTENDLISLFSNKRINFGDKTLEVHVDWIYPFLKSHSKKFKEKILQPCVSRPDCDNLAKSLLDTLTKLNYWNDDSQIFDLHFRKLYGECPGIKLKIKEYKEVNNE